MARREVIDCDCCKGKACDPAHAINVCVGYSVCPAGGASERNVERIDLCAHCAAMLLQVAVANLSEPEARQWIREARKK